MEEGVIKFGSIFTGGAAGFDLGLIWAGMVCAWQVENDPYSIRVLEKNHPGTKRYKNVEEVNPRELESVRVICGGFPCQDFSLAGQRRGTKGDRYLWPEMLRIITDITPRADWVIVENVAGILSIFQWDMFSELEGKKYNTTQDARADFEKMYEEERPRRSGEGVLYMVLEDLKALGYKVQVFIIPACALNAPHLRYRVWIVAHRDPDGNGKSGFSLNAEKDRLAKNAGCEYGEGKKKRKKPKRQAGTRDAIKLKRSVARHRTRIIADTKDQQAGGLSFGEREEKSGLGGGDQSFTDPSMPGLQEPQEGEFKGQLSHVERRGWQESWYEVATRLCRMDDGVSNRVDRLKCLGNAVVPQIVEIIGRAIVEIENDE